MSVKLNRVCRIFFAALILFLSVAAAPGRSMAEPEPARIGIIEDGVWKLDPANYTYKALRNVKELNLSGKGIHALEGIEHLSGLSVLDISYNDFDSLDPGTLNRLTELNCSNNHIASLDLKTFGRLKTLKCADNPLGELNLSTLKNLRVLDCRNCGLTGLDISANRMLMALYCSGNELPELDVGYLKRLKTLDVAGIGITELNVGRNENLVTLDCSDNPDLKELDLKSNRLIKELYTHGTGITSLDLSRLGALAAEFTSRDGYGYEQSEECRSWRLSDGALTANPGAAIQIGTEITIAPVGEDQQDRDAMTGYLQYKPGEFTSRLVSSTYDEMCDYFLMTVGPKGSVFHKTDESWIYENAHTVVEKAGISVQSRYRESIKIPFAVRVFTVFNEDGSFRYRCTVKFMATEKAEEFVTRLNKEHEEMPDEEDFLGYRGQVNTFVCGNALVIMEGIPSAAQEQMPTMESCIAVSPDRSLYLIE